MQVTACEWEDTGRTCNSVWATRAGVTHWHIWKCKTCGSEMPHPHVPPLNRCYTGIESANPGELLDDLANALEAIDKYVKSELVPIAQRIQICKEADSACQNESLDYSMWLRVNKNTGAKE